MVCDGESKNEIWENYIMNDYFLDDLVKKRLEELHPDFDAMHIERRMYEACKEDIVNYFKVKKRMTKEEFEDYFFNYFAEEAKECKEEVDAWVSLWYATYKKRVKLMLNDEHLYNEGLKQLQKLERRGTKKIPYQLLKVMKEPIIETLINNGEICFTDTIAEQYIKYCAANKKNLSLVIQEAQLNFVNEVMAYAANKSKLHGYLVYLKLGTLLQNHKYGGENDGRSESEEKA